MIIIKERSLRLAGYTAKRRGKWTVIKNKKGKTLVEVGPIKTKNPDNILVMTKETYCYCRFVEIFAKKENETIGIIAETGTVENKDKNVLVFIV